MDDAERGVTVLYCVGDDAEQDEIVFLLELDLLALQLLIDAPEPLDAAADFHNRHLRLEQRGRDLHPELLDQPFGRPSPRIDLRAEPLVSLRLKIPEGQL